MTYQVGENAACMKQDDKGRWEVSWRSIAMARSMTLRFPDEFQAKRYVEKLCTDWRIQAATRKAA